MIADVGGQLADLAAFAFFLDPRQAFSDGSHKAVGMNALVDVDLGSGSENGALDRGKGGPELQETGCAGGCHRMVGWNEVRDGAIRLAGASRSISHSLLHSTYQRAYYIYNIAYIGIFVNRQKAL